MTVGFFRGRKWRACRLRPWDASDGHRPTLQTPETPPPLWLQLLSLSAIFAIGVAAGWVVWGKNAGAARDSAGAPLQRHIVLGTNSGPGEAAPAAPPAAPSSALDRLWHALAIADADARFVAFHGTLGEMKPEDAPQVRQRLREEYQPEKGPNREWEAFFRRWGAVDPQAAIAFAKTAGDEKAQGWVLKMMIEGWARKHPTAAAQWLNEWPTAPDWEGVCAGLLKGIASQDPWMASQTAIASIPGEANWLRGEVAGHLAGTMMRRGGEEELQRWFASIPSVTPAERSFKERALQTAARCLEQRDLQTAKRRLESLPPEPWRSSPAYALVAKKLAETDRAAALNWLAALPPGGRPVGREAGKEIFRAWQEERPEEAVQWMRTVTDQKFLADVGVSLPGR